MALNLANQIFAHVPHIVGGGLLEAVIHRFQEGFANLIGKVTRINAQSIFSYTGMESVLTVKRPHSTDSFVK